MKSCLLFSSRKAACSLFGGIAIATLLTLGSQSCDSGNKPVPVDSTNTTDSMAAVYAFRNAVTPAPPGTAHPFQLSHNYPQQLPAGGENMPWLKLPIDVTDTTPDWNTGPWVAYMQAILDYVKEGQDVNLSNDAGWAVNVGGSTRWFHIPWMAYNESSGREYLHGCTNERSTTKADLDGDGDLESTQSVHLPLLAKTVMLNGKKTVVDETAESYETWAVGMYNDYASWSVGQVFPPSGVPQLDEKGLPKGLPFRDGSCVAKLLFSAADASVAPYLVKSPEWMVDRHVMVNNSPTCARSPQPVHLVQMDVAVVDHRSPTGWVYGTFVYNGTLNGATAWDNMQALGIQFGNDPGRKPATTSDLPVWQSVINPNVNIYEHLGCEKRLCGPLDNELASCMSCHGGAYTAPMDQLDNMGKNMPPIFGYTGECDSVGQDTNITYFSNRKYPEGYYPNWYTSDIPLDYSLQLWVGFSQYKTYKITGSSPCTLGN